MAAAVRAPLPRRQTAGVLAAAGVAGASFAPVFGLRALALPVLLICLVGVAVLEAGRRWPAVAPWRPLLLAAGGLLAIVETVLFASTAFGVPTSATVRALRVGLSSWRKTLESTWPARPDPDLVLFVPLLVLAAVVLGVELLDRAGGLPALLPSLAVIGVGQAYAASSGSAAYLLALGYAGTAAFVLAPAGRPAQRFGTAPGTGRGSRRQRRRGQPGRRGRRLAIPLGVVTLVLAGLVGGLLVGPLDPLQRTPYTLQRVQSVQLSMRHTTNPLDEVASRLGDPATVLFRYRTEATVDRWRLLALDDFDGSNWTTNSPFLRLGREMAPDAGVRVPTSVLRAEVELEALSGPWLPGQPMPRAVDGADRVFVDEQGDTVLASRRPSAYELSWYARDVTGQRLLTAPVDPDVPVGDLGRVPPEIAELASEAVAGKRATFQTALALERYLAGRYQAASGSDVPTGHGWAQLRRFLLQDERGTSEQFAAAYVVLARLNGIPARLAVGFRAPAESSPDGWTTVRNRDVLVWPEVAIDGIGWWPLDPAGLADPRRQQEERDRDAATEQARAKLPPPERIADPDVPEQTPVPGEETEPGPGGPGDAAGSPIRLAWLLLAVPPVGWVGGTPLLRWLRARHRRRRAPVAAVVGAWAEVRDRLRAHGVRVTPGMTVRDLAAAARPVVGGRTLDGMDRLARTVDSALWSSEPVGQPLAGEAWAGVREVVDGLRERPLGSRFRAAVHVRSLLPPS